MNEHHVPTSATAPAADAPQPLGEQSLDAQREAVRAALERRFRLHLRTGHLSPLLHLVMQYKLGSPP